MTIRTKNVIYRRPEVRDFSESVVGKLPQYLGKNLKVLEDMPKEYRTVFAIYPIDNPIDDNIIGPAEVFFSQYDNAVECLNEMNKRCETQDSAYRVFSISLNVADLPFTEDGED